MEVFQLLRKWGLIDVECPRLSKPCELGGAGAVRIAKSGESYKQEIQVASSLASPLMQKYIFSH